MRLFFGLLMAAWIVQTSGTNASLRGVSAVNDKVAWASGTSGTYLRTVDGGATWAPAIVPGAEKLDFRGIHAISERIAYLMSIGNADNSRIYKTTDAGAHWELQFTNPDAKGFFDCITFWDPAHGVVLGDAVDGHMTIFTTSDSGMTWTKQQTPQALPNEGAFAASNSALIVTGKSDAWFTTGGAAIARVYHSTDFGKTWSVADTPLRHDGASTGGFSLAFSDALHGVVVGGDYAKDKEATAHIAITSDGGKTWRAPTGAVPGGFRSAVAYVRAKKLWIAIGTSGSDVSEDGGESWKTFDTGSYNAISFAPNAAGWAVGAKGRVAAFRP